MPSTHPLPTDLLVVLGAALAVLLLFRPLRLPPTLGFMLTGMLIGPHGLRTVADTHQVEQLADLGVTLLLFVIGLEFSIGKLREYQRAFFGGGALQVLLTTGAATAIALATAPPARAVVLGGMVALSSTAMVFRLLAERRETASPAGRVMTGILLFQDFAMVPMIAVVPALARGGVSLGAAPRLLLGLGAAVVAFTAARYLMPRALALVVRSGIRELLVIGAVFACLGSAAASSALGLSAALGAFLAGILISESEYSHQVVAEILPFRDLFNSLFFVSIGMLLDLRFVAEHPAYVALLSLGVVALKAAIAALVVRGLGYPTRIAVIVGLGIAQIGEFSFVIGRLAHGLGLLEGSSYQSFLAAAIVTLGATPFLMRLAPEAGVRVASLLGERSARPEPRPVSGTGLTDHVIVVGYGLNGRNLARVLKAVGIPYVAIDLDASVVTRARREGEERLIYGDATRAETLHHCGVERAAVVVFAVADPDSDRRGVRIVRSLSRSATIIVRTRLASRVAELRRLGADEVIPEEFETSIAIFARVLRCLHVPPNLIRSQELLLRSESYEFLREGELPAGSAMERASELLAAGTTSSFLVTAGSFADGKTIRETALHSRTRTMIIAVVRGGRPTVSPGAGFSIQAGDILVLVGDHAALEAAFVELGGRTGPRD